MPGKQDRPQHFSRHEQVTQVGPTETATDWTFAIGIQRPGIRPVLQIPKLQGPLAGERRRIAAVPRRHHTIEQVDAPQNSFDQINGTSNAHQVSRATFGEKWRCKIQSFIHRCRFFADAQSADGVSREIQFQKSPGGSFSKFAIRAPLNDSE